MSDEPTLPRLPGVSWDERSQSFSNNPRKRVRTRSRGALPPRHDSSDPAVFSSDDDPGLDNYVDGRRKKRYVGSWYQQQPASSDSATGESFQPPPKTKRTLARQMDSGVFLGSDGTESEDIMETLEVPTRPKLPQLEQRPLRRVSDAELAAQRKIRECIEQGNETLDLWSMGLEDISGETIGRLSQVAPIPVVAKGVPFRQKDPELKVYLAMNRLTRLPGVLFDLNHITILSLRGNKLTDLPQGISKLRNLKELNVSQNRLRHLPAELFDLVDDPRSLETLTIHPNPFLQPDTEFYGPQRALPNDDRDHKPLKFEIDLVKTEPSACPLEYPHFASRLCGRSPLQFSNSKGVIQPGFSLPTESTSGPIPVDQSHGSLPDPLSRTQPVSKPSRVPSLFEVALRSCSRSDELPELEYYMPEDLAQLRPVLRRAAQQEAAGGLVCSRCRKAIVVPPLEWIEWYQLGLICRPSNEVEGRDCLIKPHSLVDGEQVVPFLRRACSWACGPEDGNDEWSVKVREKTEL